MALPNARLPPPSIVPVTASMPWFSFLLAVLPLTVLPAASPGASSKKAIPVSRFAFAMLAINWLPVLAATKMPPPFPTGP